MNRQYVFRLQNVVAIKKFPSGRVTRNMNFGVSLVDNVGANLGEPVDDAVDGVFVAWNQ